nr:hypothetical protein [uncultured bacterium]
MRKHEALAILTAAAFGSVCVASSAVGNEASRDTILHVFDGSDGASPEARLVGDNNGSFYGTTPNGGGTFDGGTIFKIASDGTEATVYTFSDGTAYRPWAPLLLDKKGNLFGTTVYGGNNDNGTVFRLSPKGQLTVLHAFSGSDGRLPYGGLLKIGHFLYGTTTGGGASGAGVVFSISTDGTSEKTLYAFQGGSNDGALPSAGLVNDASGNLYGTTQAGAGSCNEVSCGVVFKLSPNGAETILHAFTDGPDGAQPVARLMIDSSGNLYGTAAAGGGTTCGYYGQGCGTVFKISSDGTFSVLHAFGGGTDGAVPFSDLITDKAGNLYGTTSAGGNTLCHRQGCGTVFKLAPDGTETILHVFSGKYDGKIPAAGLTAYGPHLYGTTWRYGWRSANCYPSGCGAVFMIKR